MMMKLSFILILFLLIFWSSDLSEEWKHYLEKILLTDSSRNSGKVFFSLLTGERKSLDTSTVLLFEDCGASHLLALSGLHLGIILGAVWWIMRKSSENTLLNVGFFVILVFNCLVRTGPSVIRASFFAMMSLICIQLNARICFGYLLILSLMVNIITDIDCLISPGFYLSYLAVTAIKLQQSLPQRRQFSWMNFILLTYRIFFFTLGVVSYYFGWVVYTSPLINLILIPLFSLLTLMVYMIPIAFFYKPFQVLIIYFCEVLYNFVELIMRNIQIYLSWKIDLFPGNGYFTTGYYALLIGFYILKKYPVILRTSFLFSWIILFYFFKQNNHRIILSIPSIGRADCTLLQIQGETPRNILVDTSNGELWQMRKIRKMLFSRGIFKIHLLVVSHAHKDHYGGLIELLKSTNVQKIWFGNHFNDYFQTHNLQQLKKNREISCCFMENTEKQELHLEGKNWQLRGFQILAGKEYSLNERSLCLFLEHSAGNFLFTGDLEKNGETAMVEMKFLEKNVDYLKIPHHASVYSSSEEWLNFLSPCWAWVQTDGRKGFFSRAIQNRYSQRKIETHASFKSFRETFYW